MRVGLVFLFSLPIQCQVAVNHVVELTEEEKQEARRKAVAQYQQMELQKLQNRKRRQRKKKHKSNPHYLNFDYETEKQV